MTTLVAVQSSTGIQVGYDSQMTRSNEATQMTTGKFFARGGVVYGLAGLLRARDVIETADIPDYDGTHPRMWLLKVWVPAMKAALRGEPSIYDQEAGRAADWSVIVILGGEVFLLDTLFNPSQSERGIYTLGSGGDYARGALYAGISLSGALHVAADIDPYTGGPLVVTTPEKILESENQ